MSRASCSATAPTRRLTRLARRYRRLRE
jgi:hypothetical protein